MRASFTFADFFAGIGGFHSALSEMGGECTWACESDPAAAAVYLRNWGVEALGDITQQAPADGPVVVEPHDVLTAGFPCQPFSKSGAQRGMEEARGTLFYNIARVLEAVRPPVVLLENVRNIAGPRHTHEWDVIITTLRQLGYRVAAPAAVMSPHLLPPQMGGRPQVRERVFITATYVGDALERLQDDGGSPAAQAELLGHGLGPLVRPVPVAGWHPSRWRIEDALPPARSREETALRQRYGLTGEDTAVLDVWNDFLRYVARSDPLPGFPVWADHLEPRPAAGFGDLPAWKVNFLEKNAAFYARHARDIDAWKKRHGNLEHLAPSRRKLEWQAGATPRDLYNCVLQLRPSGVRAKAPTYLPALVAITQTSIVGPRRRRISPSEAAYLQGLPTDFSFGPQPDAASYKQAGNGVNVGVVQYVLREHVRRDQKWLPERIVDAVLSTAGAAPLPAEQPELELTG